MNGPRWTFIDEMLPYWQAGQRHTARMRRLRWAYATACAVCILGAALAVILTIRHGARTPTAIAPLAVTASAAVAIDRIGKRLFSKPSPTDSPKETAISKQKKAPEAKNPTPKSRLELPVAALTLAGCVAVAVIDFTQHRTTQGVVVLIAAGLTLAWLIAAIATRP